MEGDGKEEKIKDRGRERKEDEERWKRTPLGKGSSVHEKREPGEGPINN